ncbi:MAG TPA: hypothetical protein VFP65_11330 [Anaeromyxobacteraceae bacterium]|nr:hypothetical protein [Anaeromyxobacteraceae bacterium]
MTSSLVRRASAGLGTDAARLATAAALAGLAALALSPLAGLGRAALAGLSAGWLFAAGCAAGGLAFAAAIRVTGGRWAGGVLPLADASAAFFGPALVLLVAVSLGSAALAREASGQGAGHAAAVALRDVAATAVLFLAGRRFLGRVRRGDAPRRVGRAGVAYLALYALVLTLWVIDLVFRLGEGPAYTVLPPFYFLGAFLSGVAWVGLLSALRGSASEDVRHDLGKLLFGLLVVWTYLLWSLFLPTWYANVPEESAALLLRWHGPWRPMSIAVLVLVSVGPFWLLFGEPLKRRRATLATGAAAVLVGLLGERFLLVVPAADAPGGGAGVALGALVACGVAGAFLLWVGGALEPAGRDGGTHRA